jgi:adenine-specific DNA-methyltransferase
VSASRRCAEAGIRFTFTIHSADFIQEMSARLAGDLFGAPPPAFDVAIANPPYRKISTDSAERRALRSVGVETSNLYTGFIALIQRLLVPGGQLVGITPRSFCNGPYFRPFREDFLSQLELRRLHVFESRQAAFRDDSVLQENIIFHAVKGPGTNPTKSSSPAAAASTAPTSPRPSFPSPRSSIRTTPRSSSTSPPRPATPPPKKPWTDSAPALPRWA